MATSEADRVWARGAADAAATGVADARPADQATGGIGGTYRQVMTIQEPSPELRRRWDLQTGAGNDFLAWAIRQGYQRFYEPRTVCPDLMNPYGWLDVPKSEDLVIPLYELPPGADRTMYWFYESIVTQSAATVRVALEGNFDYDTQTEAFDPATWKINSAYAVSAANGHQLTGTMLKTRPGDAMRLRIYGTSGADNDIYFKFIGCELPYAE